jgi:hypothetical protein
VFIYRNRTEAVRALDGQSAFLFMDIGEVAREMDKLLTPRRAEEASPPRHHVA